MSQKRNISLIVGIAIPVFMVLLVAVSIYVPALFAPEPKFSFLYVSGDAYGEKTYSINQGRLIKHEPQNSPNHYKNPDPAVLYAYDPMTKQSKELSFEEAKALKFYQGGKSPEGFEVAYGSDYDGGIFPILFGGYDSDSVFIKGHNASRRVELENPSGRSYRNTRFLAWISKE